jgi:hypothetical protein
VSDYKPLKRILIDSAVLRAAASDPRFLTIEVLSLNQLLFQVVYPYFSVYQKQQQSLEVTHCLWQEALCSHVAPVLIERLSMHKHIFVSLVTRCEHVYKIRVLKNVITVAVKLPEEHQNLVAFWIQGKECENLFKLHPADGPMTLPVK